MSKVEEVLMAESMERRKDCVLRLVLYVTVTVVDCAVVVC